MNEGNANRLLRRVDWRFLLANPKPKRSICFGEGLLRRAVGQIPESELSSDTRGSGQYDLAVAVNPGVAILQASFDALRFGGEIYTEWYSPFVGGANGVQRRLEKMGFADVECYWVWPPPRFASALYWLPLGSSNAIRYFFSHRPASPSLIVRMARSFLRTIFAFGLHTRLLLPVCAIARKPPFDKHDSLRSQVNAEITSHDRQGNVGQESLPFTWMLWTPGHRPINKIVAFIFSEAKLVPKLILKIPRSSDSWQGLTSEVHNLLHLSNREKSFADSIPSVSFTSDWNGTSVIGESFVGGSPLYTYLDQDNYEELARKVTDWLIALAGNSTPSPRSEWWDRLVGSATRDFVQSYGLVFSPEELASIHATLNQLGDLPLIFEQRDCSPWNVLLNDNGQVRVLDWESAEPCGLPLLDLTYFLTYLSFFRLGAMESKEYLKAYRQGFYSQAQTGQINQECLEKYCTALKLDTAVIKPLRLLTWLVHSRSEDQRFAEDSGGTPSSSARRSSLFATLVREEVQVSSGAKGAS